MGQRGRGVVVRPARSCRAVVGSEDVQRLQPPINPTSSADCSLCHAAFLVHHGYLPCTMRWRSARVRSSSAGAQEISADPGDELVLGVDPPRSAPSRAMRSTLRVRLGATTPGCSNAAKVAGPVRALKKSGAPRSSGPRTGRHVVVDRHRTIRSPTAKTISRLRPLRRGSHAPVSDGARSGRGMAVSQAETYRLAFDQASKALASQTSSTPTTTATETGALGALTVHILSRPIRSARFSRPRFDTRISCISARRSHLPIA
jgi:hypothetical protein